MKKILALVAFVLVFAAGFFSTPDRFAPLSPTRPGTVAVFSLSDGPGSLPVPGVALTSGIGGRLQ